MGFLRAIIHRFRHPSRHKLLEKSTKRIEKELDLVKFVKRMRSIIGGTLGLLTSKQRLFVDELSKIKIHERSSNFDELTESDDVYNRVMN